MRALQHRRVVVVGYGVVTPLGLDLTSTWEKAVLGQAGFRSITRCEIETACHVVGELPEWNPSQYDFISNKEAHFWDAGFVLASMVASKQAVDHAQVVLDDIASDRVGVLIGSSLNGHDAFYNASKVLQDLGPSKISPYLLPNLCGNIPAGKVAIQFGITGVNFSPQGACASGNQAIGLGARYISAGDADFMLVGGADMPLVPEIIHGFHNMNATIKIIEGDRAFDDPACASRPFSADRKGFVLSEGAGVLLLAAQDVAVAHRLKQYAEIAGIGWNSDAFHVTKPNQATVVHVIKQALADAEISVHEIDYINAHGTSTAKGDANEVASMQAVFGKHLPNIPISSNKSQIGHTLGAAAAIEAALIMEGMQRDVLLPTINYQEDPAFSGLDFIPDQARNHQVEYVLSNAFGFGGSNCCIVFKRCP